MTLADLSLDENARVVSLEESQFSHRILELGICPNQLVRLIKRAPFKGPLALKLDDSTVMLREEEARTIIAEVI